VHIYIFNYDVYISHKQYIKWEYACGFGLALHLQPMHYCNPCSSRPAFLPPVSQVRRFHICCNPTPLIESILAC